MDDDGIFVAGWNDERRHLHIFGGLPLILEAAKSGGINLPSIEDEGAGFQLLREPVVYGLLTVGVDRIISA